MRSASESEARMSQVVSFIDLYLAISAWSLVALSLTAIGIVATWPLSGRLIARIWRDAVRLLTGKGN